MGKVKCSKCNKYLCDTKEYPLNTAHGHPTSRRDLTEESVCESERPSAGQVFFEEKFPRWVEEAIAAGDWTSGRLQCECGSLLGRFDFVSGHRCGCQLHILPPVRLNLKKIDL